MAHQLSPNFTLEELLVSATAQAKDIVNLPNFDILVQLVLLANNTLEGIRSICGGNPVLISSGYRNEALNEAVGGAENSAHLLGCAADFTVPGYGDVQTVCHAIEVYLEVLQIDQLIYENDAWVHVGRVPSPQPPRHQCLTISGGTTTNGIA
jgi:hypothetical protein